MIRDTEKQNEDKLRLALLYVLSCDIPASDESEIEKALVEAGCDVKPLQYIKRYVFA